MFIFVRLQICEVHGSVHGRARQLARDNYEITGGKNLLQDEWLHGEGVSISVKIMTDLCDDNVNK